jgi:DNA-directed RNA polymerase specialized sigma24 family protein
MSDPSATVLLEQLKAGPDPAAAQALWRQYFDRLTALARRRLTARTRRAADEEDVALSALDSFFRGVADGRFPRLDDRDDLWQVLVLLTERKAIDRVRRETAAKRGGGAVRGDSVFARPDDSTRGGAEQVAESGPSPEFAALFADECGWLLRRLGDADLQQVALLKLEGHTNEEIAARIGRTVRSVQRKLDTSRAVWDQTADQPD